MKRHKYAIEPVLNGDRKDWSARSLRAFLRCGEPLYRAAIGTRNFMFDRQWRKTFDSPIPVISVGNLTTGGTGKTPLVRWIAQRLLRLDLRPAIVSRGYGAKIDDSGLKANDEFWELKSHLPDVPHIQNPDRVAAVRQAISAHAADIIILDDGFQHRRLKRDFDVLLIDATRPFGFDHLLPRGLLREPLASIGRADFVLITRVNQVPREQLAPTVLQILDVAPQMPLGAVKFAAARFLDADSQTWPLDHLANQRVLGFCGIGNPQGFQRLLKRHCPNLVSVVPFADHHGFAISDIARLEQAASELGASALVCTKKDMVKVRKLSLPATPIYELAIRADLGDDEEAFAATMERAIGRQVEDEPRLRCA